jgi:hypothetical protein
MMRGFKMSLPASKVVGFFFSFFFFLGEQSLYGREVTLSRSRRQSYLVREKREFIRWRGSK